jgi:hypothetical protein
MNFILRKENINVQNKTLLVGNIKKNQRIHFEGKEICLRKKLSKILFLFKISTESR